MYMNIHTMWNKAFNQRKLHMNIIYVFCISNEIEYGKFSGVEKNQKLILHPDQCPLEHKT